MTTQQDRLTIGEFGRRAGLSPKALRLYDAAGLLTPAAVDPSTGYRFYSADQLERARRISVLRQLEMPLATVADVLSGSDEDTARKLERWWAGQEAAMAARKGALNYFREQLSRTGASALTPRPVLVRDVPETKVATIRADVDQPRLVTTIMQGMGALFDHLTAAGAGLDGESWVLYHGFVTPDSEGTVELCVPFTGTAEPSGPIAIRVEPAHREAYCTITKAECFYPRIMHAYDLVDDWIRQAGLSSRGAPREIYLPGFDCAAADDPSVHIAQPVEES